LEYNKRSTSSVRSLSDHDKKEITGYRTDKKKLEGKKNRQQVEGEEAS